MNRIAFVTTCKGRLHHLRETLPLIVAQDASEVIVVDYGCPDRAGDWTEANFPAVKVVRINDDPDFSTSRARNLGAAQATADWLVFIDADIKASPGWIGWMQQNLRPGNFYLLGPVSGRPDIPLDGQAGGTVICARADFDAIGGYDETFEGWGNEDEDLYNRLLFRGISMSRYPGEFVTAIPHGNNERAGWAGMENITQKMLLNKCYIALKMHVMITKREGALSAEMRQNLMDQTKRALVKWFAEGSRKPLAIRHTTPVGRAVHLQGDNLMRSELTFTIHVEHQPARQ